MRIFISLTIVFSTIVYMITLGAPLIHFWNPPSLLLIIGIMCGGVLFSYDLQTIQEALTAPFKKSDITGKDQLKISNFFDLSSRLVMIGATISFLICIIQICYLDDHTNITKQIGVSLLSIFYGISLSELIFQPMKMAAISRFE